MGELSLWEKVREFVGDIAFHVFLWSSGVDRKTYVDGVCEQRVGAKLKANRAFISIGGKMPACYRLIKSGWKRRYHLLYEDPECGDHHFEHHFVSESELIEKFPFADFVHRIS